MESESTEERLANIRIQDAVLLNAQVLTTACPFCLLTLEDATKTSGNEGRIVVKDVLELLVDSLAD
jgi:Fe-S oxidoreductase